MVRFNSGIPVSSANAIQISGTNTPSRSKHTISMSPPVWYNACQRCARLKNLLPIIDEMQGKYQRNLRKDERIEKSALLGTYAWTVTKVPFIRGEKDSEVKSWHHIVAEWLSIELKNTKKGSLFSWARDSLFGTYSRVIIWFWWNH